MGLGLIGEVFVRVGSNEFALGVEEGAAGGGGGGWRRGAGLLERLVVGFGGGEGGGVYFCGGEARAHGISLMGCVVGLGLAVVG